MYDYSTDGKKPFFPLYIKFEELAGGWFGMIKLTNVDGPDLVFEVLSLEWDEELINVPFQHASLYEVREYIWDYLKEEGYDCT